MESQAGSSKDITFTVPRNSKGVSDQMKSEAIPTFLKVETPSSYLLEDSFTEIRNHIKIKPSNISRNPHFLF